MTLRQIAAIAGAAQKHGISEATMPRLRGLFDGVHLTWCNDDDVQGVDPVLQVPGLNVYLVDGRSHCLALTEDLQAATGLLLAEVS